MVSSFINIDFIVSDCCTTVILNFLKFKSYGSRCCWNKFRLIWITRNCGCLNYHWKFRRLTFTNSIYSNNSIFVEISWYYLCNLSWRYSWHMSTIKNNTFSSRCYICLEKLITCYSWSSIWINFPTDCNLILWSWNYCWCWCNIWFCSDCKCISYWKSTLASEGYRTYLILVILISYKINISKYQSIYVSLTNFKPI